jgi:hypothetical protein
MIMKTIYCTLIAIMFFGLSSLAQSNYVVTNAEESQFNGTYVYTGVTDMDGKAFYIQQEDDRFGMAFLHGQWRIGEHVMYFDMGGGVYMVDMMMDWYQNDDNGDTPPASGWEQWGMPSLISVQEKGLSIAQTNFVITNAEESQFNGTYVYTGVTDMDGKAFYIQQEDDRFGMAFLHGQWRIGEHVMYFDMGGGVYMVDMMMDWYQNDDNGDTPPASGWEQWGMPSLISVQEEGLSIGNYQCRGINNGTYSFYISTFMAFLHGNGRSLHG